MRKTIQEPQRAQISQESLPQVSGRRRRISIQSRHWHVIRETSTLVPLPLTIHPFGFVVSKKFGVAWIFFLSIFLKSYYYSVGLKNVYFIFVVSQPLVGESTHQKLVFLIHGPCHRRRSGKRNILLFSFIMVTFHWCYIHILSTWFLYFGVIILLCGHHKTPVYSDISLARRKREGWT